MNVGDINIYAINITTKLPHVPGMNGMYPTPPPVAMIFAHSGQDGRSMSAI